MRARLPRLSSFLAGPEQLLAQRHEALRTEVSVLRAQVQELVFSSSLGCSC